MKAKSLVQATSFLSEKHRKHINKQLAFHRLLMVFFLCGYVIVILALAFEISVISQLFISLIFFLGAVFVLMGIMIQSRLLSQLATTLKGLIPICSKCHKVRDDEGYWHHVDQYISQRSDVEFSHSICKQCSDELYGGQDWYDNSDDTMSN
jgi:hypothetical protein